MADNVTKHRANSPAARADYKAYMQQVDPEHALLNIREVEGLLGMTRRHFVPLEKKGEFPQRIKIGHQFVAYRKAQVYKWIEDNTGNDPLHAAPELTPPASGGH